MPFLKLLRFLTLLVCLWCPSTPARPAGPFAYRLPQRPVGIDPQAWTVVGEPQTHHLVRYENMYFIARRYDLGFWELARYHREIDHWYLPWGQDLDIPTRWILPPVPTPQGIIINAAELRLYRFFPDQGQVRTYPIGIGVMDYKTPFRQFRVTAKAENPGWRIPVSLRKKYGMSYMPPGDENPVGSHWLGLSHYGIHGTCYPHGVGRLVSHGCIRLYPEDIAELYQLTPVGTPVQIIYAPVKLGFRDGRIFIEVHKDVYHKIPDMLLYARELIQNHHLENYINWTRFLRAIEEETGAPVDISR
ncbi:MAG: L,D-transpeptidase family protein [Deltaproteobacteria bacterium]|nr:L,D-transpeptidase family protein [Deltaproteobacteria bacterium]MBW1953283.1 L,D-transpeptidase family protein [Deltaproteobacteria bacterium]MBW1987444.1 L,D-transpeptidase family protein [Deltaproteobacteria bacterium]MBW2135517.1 L,D-transpeptidase family protein [Deltaproteobacteria bacterium]